MPPVLYRTTFGQGERLTCPSPGAFMKQCEWYPDGKNRCQNEATLKVLVSETPCQCGTCQSAPKTFWICSDCAEVAPVHWREMGVEAHF
jgi:hypothetical protein